MGRSQEFDLSSTVSLRCKHDPPGDTPSRPVERAGAPASVRAGMDRDVDVPIPGDGQKGESRKGASDSGV